MSASTIQMQIDKGIKVLCINMETKHKKMVKSFKKQDGDSTMVTVGITTEEIMKCIPEKVGKAQKAYDEKIKKVQKDLTKQVDAQKYTLDLLTTQLNQFSQGIESNFNNLKKEQVLICESLKTIKED